MVKWVSRMFSWSWIFGIVFLVLRVRYASSNELHHVSCEEFEQGARFDPYVAIDSMWKIFYFWSNNSEIYPIIFSLPAKQRVERFRVVVEAVDPELAATMEWHRATLFMEPRPGVMAIFMYQGSPGAFRVLIKTEQRKTVRPHPVPLLSFADVRMKMVDRLLGMMVCEDLSAYALARVDEMPQTEEECEEAAALLGLPLEYGRSHLFLANYTKHNMDKEL